LKKRAATQSGCSDDLEAAEPWHAIEALEHLASALYQLDRAARLVLPPKGTPAA